MKTTFADRALPVKKVPRSLVFLQKIFAGNFEVFAKSDDTETLLHPPVKYSRIN